MKKLATISVFLAVVIAFACFELWLDTRNYKKLSEELRAFQIVLKANEEDISVREVRNEYERIKKGWEETSVFSMMITNHNIIRSINEKLAYLDGYIETGVYSDALSSTIALIKISDDLRCEKNPVMGNLF